MGWRGCAGRRGREEEILGFKIKEGGSLAASFLSLQGTAPWFPRTLLLVLSCPAFGKDGTGGSGSALGLIPELCGHRKGACEPWDTETTGIRQMAGRLWGEFRVRQG